MPRKPLTDKHGDVRALTWEDFAVLQRLNDVHPEIAAAFKRLRRRARKIKHSV